MEFRFGWFSTGRDEAARELLQIVMEHISKEMIPAKVDYIFCNRARGESIESDRFIQLAETLRIPLFLLSSRDFLPSLRQTDKEAWRISYHRETTHRIQGRPVDIIVLAGYMLIVSPSFSETFSVINLHPAAPKGPTGTWQEVIWTLIQKRAAQTGAMIHLVTQNLDEGPPITFVTFPIHGPDFDPLWKDFDSKLKHRSFQQLVKAEGENNPLFKEIRRQGVRRELPLLVVTLKALSEKRVMVEKGKVFDSVEKPIEGICLNDEMEKYLKSSHL